MEIEQEFEISGKVDNIITDNGSNMLKVFHLLEVENDPTTRHTSSDSTESDDEEELQPVEICSSELDDIKPNHYSCFAHSL